jgi:hypothetical protein
MSGRAAPTKLIHYFTGGGIRNLQRRSIDLDDTAHPGTGEQIEMRDRPKS